MSPEEYLANLAKCWGNPAMDKHSILKVVILLEKLCHGKQVKLCS